MDNTETVLEQPERWMDIAARYLFGDSWIGKVFLVIFFTLLLAFIVKRVILKLLPRLMKTRTYWDNALIAALQRPLNWLIWILGLSWAVEIVWVQTHDPLFTVYGPMRDIGVIWCLAWFLIRFIREVQDHIVRKGMMEEAAYDRTTVDAISKLLRASVIITAVLVALQNLGFSISGVLAFGGIGGIAVGFAAKDLLANFFGGLMIYLDRPFNVGDWIRSPDRDIEGTVEEIGWRLTRIRTFDKRPLYLPNATFATIAVENPSRMTNRRIYETIGVRYDDAGKVRAIIEDVRKMLENHPEIDTGQTLIVNFNAFGPSSLDFFIYTFTRTTEWVKYHQIKQEILLNVLDIIEGHGAEVAFPTTTVHLYDDTPREAALPAGAG
ncbi:MAG: mechanosensitive ion channel family protein [Gammaproteobacteria bacterium]|nr:MAG: mechanosensitive ion channel family protein [Gammaproteobacteria bacterium]